MCVCRKMPVNEDPGHHDERPQGDRRLKNDSLSSGKPRALGVFGQARMCFQSGPPFGNSLRPTRGVDTIGAILSTDCVRWVSEVEGSDSMGEPARNRRDAKNSNGQIIRFQRIIRPSFRKSVPRLAQRSGTASAKSAERSEAQEDECRRFGDGRFSRR